MKHHLIIKHHLALQKRAKSAEKMFSENPLWKSSVIAWCKRCKSWVCAFGEGDMITITMMMMTMVFDVNDDYGDKDHDYDAEDN